MTKAEQLFYNNKVLQDIYIGDVKVNLGFVKRPILEYMKEIASLAFDAGFSRCIFEVSPHNGLQPDKEKFIHNLFNNE